MLNTLLIGFGGIAQGLAEDKIYGEKIEYATHAQVLKAHSSIRWDWLVEPNKSLQQIAIKNWKLKYIYDNINQFIHFDKINLIVFAEPENDNRLDIIKKFKYLKCIIFEKPVCKSLQQENLIINYCREKNIKTAVNYFRRYNKNMLNIKKNLANIIGNLQFGSAIYCNGYKNNAVHLIDLLIYFYGDVKSVRCIRENRTLNSPQNDYKFEINLFNNRSIIFNSVHSQFYRENMIDLWGEKARLCLPQEGTSSIIYIRKENRLISNEMELDMGNPVVNEVNYSNSMLMLYDRLIDVINGKIDRTPSSLEDSIKTSFVIAGIDMSRDNNYREIYLNEI